MLFLDFPDIGTNIRIPCVGGGRLLPNRSNAKRRLKGKISLERRIRWQTFHSQ